jgi:hypothetical protein
VPRPPESISPANTEWVFKQFLFDDVLRELDDHFRQLNIGYMPVKGAYLICSGLAKKIVSRHMFDIDVLVRENDFDIVIDHFTALPKVVIAEKSWPLYKKGWQFEVTLYYPFEGRTINVDIHKSINLRQRFFLPPEALFARGIKGGLRRTLPCAEDALAICLCHRFSHVAHVFPDVASDDVPVLISDSFDWARFWKIAASTGIAAFMYYTLKKYERKGMIRAFPVPSKTVKFLYADFLIMVAGNHGFAVAPSMLRRLCFELPFCRDPLGLILDKYARSRG